MRVLLVSTSYPAHDEDWRGRFILDMADALASIPAIELKLWAPPGPVPANAVYIATADQDWLEKLSRQGGIAHLLRRRGPLALPWVLGLLRRQRAAYRNCPADVLHINWLQNALSLPASTKPALITVLGSDYGLLGLPGMVSLLRHAMRGRRVTLAPNADWMAARLEACFGDMASVQPIPFGIASPWFEATRTVDHGQPLQWLAVTRLTRAKLGPLFEWGRDLFGARHRLHLFGPMQESGIEIPDWVHYHGPTYPAELLENWFPHAAGLITLSRHDEGRPQIMLEAMAAGLPVIASDLPAHIELVRHEKSGYVIHSAQELISSLNYLADIEVNRHMGEMGREWVKTHIGSWSDSANRYFSAYKDLLS